MCFEKLGIFLLHTLYISKYASMLLSKRLHSEQLDSLSLLVIVGREFLYSIQIRYLPHSYCCSCC